VRAKKRRIDRDRTAPSKLACGAQHFSLAGQIETIAGLDLDGAHAVFDQGRETLLRCRDEGRFVGGARGPHRRGDTAAATGDLLVAGAGQAQREFVRAMPGVDEMRMAIDKARCHPGAADVFARPVIELARKIGTRADPRELAVAHRQRGIGNRFVRVAVRA
jgi:hypothetical protein